MAAAEGEGQGASPHGRRGTRPETASARPAEAYHGPMEATDTPADGDACYRALKARDARFDGCFFTGVTSTGIYCRPVCKVRTPRRENCRFFGLAAQAERAGFRPCLRCRPELAPQSVVWSVQDAGSILAGQAARLLDAPEAWDDDGPTVARLAARLGVSDRHLRRLFEAQFGVSPLQYLQTRRLLTAKQLLADTDLPIAQVAPMSGFASLRRFNAAFAQHYGLNPSALRRARGTDQVGASHTVARLGYRPPYDVEALLGFLRGRAIAGMEEVGPRHVARTLRLVAGGRACAGWLRADFDAARAQVRLQVADSLRPALPQVIHRVRAWLDLDADPRAINAVLHAAFPHGDALRVPGTLDGFELAVRAVLGQQVTVAASCTFAQRLVAQFGEPVATPWPQPNRLFPTPAVLARADSDTLGQMGIVRQRQGAIVALARAVDSGALALHGGADVPATLAQLCQLPGIGDWTAQYIALRARRWPDAFPAGDVALQKSLGVRAHKNPARAALQASLAWQPWRGYAVIRTWAGHHAGPPPGDCATAADAAQCATRHELSK